MEKLIIKGSSKLDGEVEIIGAKNAAVAILPAALIATKPVTIGNLPNISDIDKIIDILNEIGAKVERVNKHKIIIDPSNIKTTEILTENTKKFRASYYLLGALLTKYKKSAVGMPGGCVIGKRPIDQHIKGFEALGADVIVDEKGVYVEANKLIGTEIVLDVVSVGATINVLLASVLAEGQTIIKNCAKEPHVVDVSNFLNKLGAKIKGIGTDTLIIEGVEKLGGDIEYNIVPDQIEAGTFMVAGFLTGGKVKINNCNPSDLKSISDKLIEMGANIEEGIDYIKISRNSPINPVKINTLPHPGFPTDMQSQFGVALALASGTSIIHETIWEARFSYIYELNKMGANIVENGNEAIFKGVKKLKAAKVHATDLRAGAALIIAGISAEGITEVTGVEYIDRGYENVEEKFRKLGANIERIKND